MALHSIYHHPPSSHNEDSKVDQKCVIHRSRQIVKKRIKELYEDSPVQQQTAPQQGDAQYPQQQASNTTHQMNPAPMPQHINPFTESTMNVHTGPGLNINSYLSDQNGNAITPTQHAPYQTLPYGYHQPMIYQHPSQEVHTHNSQQPVPQQGHAQHPQQLNQPQQIKPPPVDPAFRVGKSGRQLEILLNDIYKQRFIAGGLKLGINKLGIRYAIFGFEFVFFEDSQFEDNIVNYAVTQLGMKDLSSTTIKNLMKVLRGNDSYWIKDDEKVHNPCVRVVNQGFPNIIYFFSPLQYVVMSLQSLEWRSGYIGVLAPTGAKHATYDIRYFNSTDLANRARSGSMKVPNLVSIFDSIGIKNEHRPLLVSWMIHSLVAREYYLFEIASKSESVSKNACKAIKEIIDPSEQSLYKIPLKPMTIARHGLDHYLLNFYSDKALSEVQQEALLDLMIGDGIKVDGIKQCLDKAQCFVKRPVILCANNSGTVINHQKLKSRTINIELYVNNDNFSKLSTHQFDAARTELIQLAMVCSESLYSQQANMDDISSLLVALANSCGDDHNEYLSRFNKWQQENMFLELDDNDTALLIYRWARDHLNKEHEFCESGPIKKWKDTLSSYAESEGIVDWDTKSHRLIGEEFRSSNLVLNKLGIRVESAGRGSRLSNWTITVPTKISIAPTHCE